MTERLGTLLRDEVAHLPVPPPDTAALLARGRSLRGRRRATLAAGATAAVLVVALGAGQVLGGDTPDKAVDPAPAVTSDLGSEPAFALGKTLYLDSGSRSVTFDEIVQTIFYTSAGLLVRTNENGFSDGGAPFHFALVGEDGTAQPLELTLGEVAPGIDPEQPYLAYAEMVDQLVQVIVVDVTTEEIVATVGVPDAGSWEGFEVPPVALSGDTVYVGGKKTWAVDWRTGEVRVAEQLGGGFPEVQGGHTVTSDADGTQVVDVETGETVLDVDDNAFATLSPDGRAAVVSDFMSGTAQLWDLSTGTSTEAPPSERGYGWTRDGRLFVLTDSAVQVCEPSGGCTETKVDLPEPSGDEFFRMGGFAYQS